MGSTNILFSNIIVDFVWNYNWFEKSVVCISISLYLWEYLSVILSDYITGKISSTFDRCLAGIWLLVCTLLLSLFSGFLYDSIIKGPNINKLKFEQGLYTDGLWKNSKINLFDYNVYEFIANDVLKNELVYYRLEIWDPFELYFNKRLQQKMFRTVFDENSVILADSVFVSFLWEDLHRKYFNNYIEGIDYYMTEPKVTYYYLFTLNNTFVKSYMNIINGMYVIIL